MLTMLIILRALSALRRLSRLSRCSSPHIGRGDDVERQEDEPGARLHQIGRAYCQPGDTADCMAPDCPLDAYRPWSGPGHAPRRNASPAQREAAVRATAASLRARGYARVPQINRQTPSTPQNGEFDGQDG